MSATLLHRTQLASSPPSSFTPPRSPRYPTPSPPPSPSPRGKGKGILRVPLNQDEFINDGDDEASSNNNSPSKPSSSYSRPREGSSLRNGRNVTSTSTKDRTAPPVFVLTRGDARAIIPVDEQGSEGDGNEENGWGWEEEHTWGEVSPNEAKQPS